MKPKEILYNEEKEATGDIASSSEKNNKSSPDHLITGKISNILILFFAFFLVVKTLSTILGIDIKGETYALIVAMATAVLYAVRWYQKKTSIEPVAKIAKVIIVIGLICLFIKPVWKVFSDKPLNITTITEGVKAGMNKPPEVKKQKSWKIVFEKEFVGIGFTGGKDKDGCIYTAMNGRDYFYGDKIIIEGVNAQVWYDGGWQNTEDGKFQYINKSNKSKTQTAVRTKKGEIIIITIKRFM